MVRIRFFCPARPKIQHLRSDAGSESGTFGPLGKKINKKISKQEFKISIRVRKFVLNFITKISIAGIQIILKKFVIL